MPCSASPDEDFHKKSSFRIKHDDHSWFFTSKLVPRAFSKSTINAAAASSFRVYYGDVSGAVPFTWEARPGTPKHTFSHNNDTTHLTIPAPLTPPPSYYSSNNLTNSSSSNNQDYSRSKLQLLHTFLRRMNPNNKCKASPRSHTTLSSPSWSSSSNSLCSDPTVVTPPTCAHRRRKRFSSRGSSFDDQYRGRGRGMDQVLCPSRLCFGIRG